MSVCLCAENERGREVEKSRKDWDAQKMNEKPAGA